MALGVVATLLGLVQAILPGLRSATVWMVGLGVIGAVVFAVVRQRPRSQLVAHYPAGPWTITVALRPLLLLRKTEFRTES